MNVERIKLVNFRNYEAFDFCFDEGVHIFTGQNAQGKTNLLEALFLAVLGKSFRAGHDEELINWTSQHAMIEISFVNAIARHDLNLSLSRDGTRENLLDGQGIKKREIVGYLNAVLFCPEDLGLIKGSPSIRRRFLDFTISQVDRGYYHDLIKFNRVLLQRNNLLKKISYGSAKETFLELWDEQLVDLAGKLYYRRVTTLNLISELAKQRYDKITNGAERFSAHYFVFGRVAEEQIMEYREWYRHKIYELREKDIRRGATELGPHRDDINFMIDDYPGKFFASQGQQRTAVLALKLAEIEIMKQTTGEYPILLLDDVMSELDHERRQKLIMEIDGKIQTFLTGTECFTSLNEMNATYYSVTGGKVVKV
jgi:DNA replication and repair protein RecF